MSNVTDIVVPDLGDFEDVEVIEVLVSVGDHVAREDGLITLETDKAAMDVPAPEHGTIEALTVSVGDTVSTGDVIGKIAVEVGDTVVVTPAIEAEVMQGDTTVVASPASGEGGGLQTISVPDLGDFEDVDVIEVHVEPGQVVALEDPLITLETDKAAMEVPSTAAGTVDSVMVSVGDTVSEGTPIVVVDAVAAAPAAEQAEAPAAEAAAPAANSPPPPPPPPPVAATPKSLPTIDEAGFSKAHASPSVRKLARELGVTGRERSAPSSGCAESFEYLSVTSRRNGLIDS